MSNTTTSTTPEVTAHRSLQILRSEIKSNEGKLKNMKRLGVKRLNILLFGKPGTGKSTFLNTIVSTLDGSFVPLSVTGGGDSHITKTYEGFPLLDAEKFSHQIVIMDPWGYTESAYKNGELREMLDGQLPMGTEMKGTYERELIEKEKLRKIHIVVYVVDAKSCGMEEHKEILSTLKAEVEKRGIPLVVLVSQIDTIDPDIKKLVLSADDIGLSKNLTKQVDSFEEKTGTPKTHILKVLNLKDIDDLSNPFFCLKVLKVFEKILDFADTGFQRQIKKHILENKPIQGDHVEGSDDDNDGKIKKQNEPRKVATFWNPK